MNDTIDNKSNIIEYSIFRALLILMVVLGHCSYLSIITDYGSFNIFDQSLIGSCLGQKFLYYPTYVIYSFHMPAFIFLSGAMFELHKGKYLIDKISFIKNKFIKLFVPFILITTIYVVPVKYFVGYWLNSENLIKDIFIGQYLLQGNNSLWFLLILFIIFIVFIVFYKVCMNCNFSFLFLYNASKGVNTVGPTPYIWDLDFSFKNYFSVGI